MKVLFWNTHKNTNINSILIDLIIENDISIVVLAEYDASLEKLLVELLRKKVIMREYNTIGCDRIKIIGKIKNVQPQLQNDYYSIQIINDIDIMCCVHLQSQLYPQINRRQIIMENIMFDIQKIEEELRSENTIIVGDFNINPYDYDCMDARYFHGIPFFEEAIRKKRTIVKKEYSMFYNPMWNFLGDFNKPYGTYYYNNGDAVNAYWNIFDQVIIRPALRERFVKENLKIISETKIKYLLDEKGHPDKSVSDHLPIMFEIKEV